MFIKMLDKEQDEENEEAIHRVLILSMKSLTFQRIKLKLWVWLGIQIC